VTGAIQYAIFQQQMRHDETQLAAPYFSGTGEMKL